MILVLALGLIIFYMLRIHVDKAFKRNDIPGPTYKAKINDNLYSPCTPFVYRRLFSEPQLKQLKWPNKEENSKALVAKFSEIYQLPIEKVFD